MFWGGVWTSFDQCFAEYEDFQLGRSLHDYKWDINKDDWAWARYDELSSRCDEYVHGLRLGRPLHDFKWDLKEKDSNEQLGAVWIEFGGRRKPEEDRKRWSAIMLGGELDDDYHTI